MGGSGYPRLNARMGIRNRCTYRFIGERSEPLSSVFNDQTSGIYIFTRKMVPIPRRARSFLVVHVNRKEEEEGETEQQQFTKGCNILHRLQVYHLTLTFIIHNKYTSTLHLYTYMHIPIMIALIIMPFIDRINVRYKLLGTYMREVDKNS